jgi:hypothetical protein
MPDEPPPTIDEWRVVRRGPRPSHPSLAAFLLIVAITAAIVALAAASTFGFG